MSMRRLRSLPHGQLSGRGIEIGDAAAGFERRRMTSLKDGAELYLDRRVTERLVGCLLVADFPVKDVIGFLVTVFANDRRVRISRVMRIDEHRKLFIIDLDQLGGVSRG